MYTLERITPYSTPYNRLSAVLSRLKTGNNTIDRDWIAYTTFQPLTDARLQHSMELWATCGSNSIPSHMTESHLDTCLNMWIYLCGQLDQSDPQRVVQAYQALRLVADCLTSIILEHSSSSVQSLLNARIPEIISVIPVLII